MRIDVASAAIGIGDSGLVAENGFADEMEESLVGIDDRSPANFGEIWIGFNGFTWAEFEWGAGFEVAPDLRLPKGSVVEFIRIEPVPVVAVEDAGVGDSAEDSDGINAIDAGHNGGLGAALTETGTEATAHDESRDTTKGDEDDCRDNRDTAF